MRVLVLSNMYPSPRDPSCGVFVRDQVEELRARHGIEPALAVSRGRAPSRGSKLVKYARLHLRAWALAPRAFDVAHLHYPSPAHLFAAWPAILLRPKRFVVTVHRGELYGLPRRGLRRRWVRWLLGRASHLIAVSGDLARKLTEELGIPSERIAVIDVGSDLRTFRACRAADKPQAKRAVGLDAAASHVLFVGRLSERKGVDVLLEAAARLETRGPVVLLLVGSGPLRERLEAQAVALRSVEVRWLGERDHAELPRWFAAADVFVLPSRGEGRPTVVLEAMACGTPVVATRVGGTPELIRDEVNGLLVDPDDAAGLARGLGRLLGEPATRERLARRALEDVAEHSLERQAARIAAIYRGQGER